MVFDDLLGIGSFGDQVDLSAPFQQFLEIEVQSQNRLGRKTQTKTLSGRSPGDAEKSIVICQV